MGSGSSNQQVASRQTHATEPSSGASGPGNVNPEEPQEGGVPAEAGGDLESKENGKTNADSPVKGDSAEARKVEHTKHSDPEIPGSSKSAHNTNDKMTPSANAEAKTDVTASKSDEAETIDQGAEIRETATVQEFVGTDDALRKYPHLREHFTNIDGFVKELKDNPKLEGETYGNTITLAQLTFRKFSKVDRYILGSYYSLLDAAVAITNSYGTLLGSLGVKCMAIITQDISEKNAETVEKLRIFREIVRANAYNPFGEKLCEAGMLRHYAEDLRLMDSNAVFTGRGEREKKWFDGILCTLHNYSSNQAIRQPLRDSNFVTHLLPFLKSRQLFTLITLAKLIDETENEHLLADDSIFDVLLDLFRAAQNGERIPYDLTVGALINGIANLTKNESNKTVLYKKGAVPILMKVLNKGTDVEKERAVKCIWEFSFDKKIKKSFTVSRVMSNFPEEDEKLLELLENLKLSSTNALSKAAKNALWEIHQDERAHSPSKQTTVGETEAVTGHVMISYQWRDQEVLLKIKDSLIQNGYIVWMDIDNMEGSTLEAMAKAVEDAIVVLVCMSERYKLSQNCRSEAEYAFSLKRKIVPLIMQDRYTPDGWLGIIKGTKLFFDFSGKYKYADKLEGLLKELGPRGKQVQSTRNGPDVDIRVATLSHTKSLEVTRGHTLSNWSEKDVQNWLTKLRLQNKSSMKDLSVEDLLFLREMSTNAPEYYYHFVETKLGLDTLKDMRVFCRAIGQLEL